jgi:hypothetical protein
MEFDCLQVAGISLIAMVIGWIIGAIHYSSDGGFWCRSGRHYLAPWKPCPGCISAMVEEYKNATDKELDAK